jgi:tRNA 2-thiouridine synthesizing protein E
METLVADKTIDRNDQGYMLDMDQWDADVAKAIAEEEGIALGDRHFDVLNFLRHAQEEGTSLSIRRVGKSGVVDIKEFYQLFPDGPLKKASKIAGIPKPVSCI